MSKISSFKIPVTYSDKSAELTININHDILHNNGGHIIGFNFYSQIGAMLNNLISHKNELTVINNHPSLQFGEFNGWSEGDINHIVRHQEFSKTFEMNYPAVQGYELNAAGLNLEFSFI